MALSDDQKTQLADLYDEAKRTGDSASMSRIRVALQQDADQTTNAVNPTGAGGFFAGMGQRVRQARDALIQISDAFGSGSVDQSDPAQVAAYKKMTQQHQDAIDESGRIDKELNASTSGQLGNLATSALGVLAAPASLPAQAAVGAGLGALEPTTGDQSRAGNMALGAAGGAAGQAIGSGLGAVAGRLIQPVRNSLSGFRQQALQILADHGVTALDLAQTTGDRVALTAKNAAGDSPVLSPSELPAQAARQFTAAAMHYMGVQSDEATPAVMNAGRRVLKDTYDDIAARTQILPDQQLSQEIQRIGVSAHRNLREPDANIIATNLAEIEDTIMNRGTINGTLYKNIQSHLSDIPSDGGKQPFVTQIRQALTGALQRSASPQDAALLAQTNQRYAAMKAIQKGINDNNQVSPAALFNSMDTAKGANNTVFGTGTNQGLAELAQAGKVVLGKGTPNSGTPQRLMGSALFGAAGGIADAHLHGGSIETPMVTLAAAVGGPALARSLIENPRSVALFTHWANSQGITTAADVAAYIAKKSMAGAGSLGALSIGQDQTQTGPN